MLAIRMYTILSRTSGRPQFRDVRDWCLVAMAGGATFALGRWRLNGTYLVAFLAVSTYLAFHSGRDGWILVLASLVALTSNAPKSCPSSERFTHTWPRVLASGVSVALMLGLTAWFKDLSPGRLDAAVRRAFPEQAAVYLERNVPSEPIYNYLDWGGYLIWRLPGYPVSMDGRTNLHGDERIERSQNTWSGRADRWADPEFQAARIIVADRKIALAEILRLDQRFELIHEDPVAVIFRSRAGKETGRPNPAGPE